MSTRLGDFLQARSELAPVPAVVAHVHYPEGPPAVHARGADPDARFDVASLTKVVVTTTALMVMDTDVDAPVQRWVPEFAGDGKDSVTLADLLTHRGGLWEWWPLYVRHAGDPIAAAARLPLRHAPRSEPRYSDLGFMLLGAVVEREAGLPLAEAARELVLGPAGMEDSGFAPGDAVPSAHGDSVERTMIESGDPYPVDEDAASFAGWRDGVLAGEPNDGNTHHAFGGAAGHAGLFATAPDLARWGAALLTGELAPRERVDRWLAPVHGDRALGFRRYGDRVAGHGGFTGGQVRLAPAEGIVTVLLTNRLLAEGGPPDVEPAATELMELALEGAAHAA